MGLAVALVVPSAAMASGDQNLRAGFAKKKTKSFGDPSVPFPFPTFGTAQPSKKKGTLGVEVSITNIVGDAPAANIARIHMPEEVKFTTKKIRRVDPAALAGLDPVTANQVGGKSKVGQGGARALGLGGVGPVSGFNGTKSVAGSAQGIQGGQPTIVLHSFAANVPIVLVGELQNSPLGPPYGKVLHVPVSTDVGGGVPPGIVIDLFNTTVSKTTKIKKKKKKKKKQYVAVKKCGDGVLSWQAEFTYANAPPQSPVFEQPCG
jgi:hypothetical protein